MLRLFSIFGIFIFLASCASTPGPVDTTWTYQMYFQEAQDAMAEYKYSLALYYYGMFLVRHPENRRQGIAAEYERAFIFYKTRRLDEAEEAYKDIIAKYDESPHAVFYPSRFRKLAELGLESIARSRFVNMKLLWRFREAQWAREHGESLTAPKEEEQ